LPCCRNGLAKYFDRPSAAAEVHDDAGDPVHGFR
jgi:hypothetical protein